MVATLQGGNNIPSASQPKSFKDATQAGLSDAQKSVQSSHPVYIVDKSEEVPTLEIKQPEVFQNILQLKEQTLICRFNGLWPKTKDLIAWNNTIWLDESQVLLCSKGFFLVIFPS